MMNNEKKAKILAKVKAELYPKMTNEESCSYVNRIQQGSKKQNLAMLLLKEEPLVCEKCSDDDVCPACSKKTVKKAKLEARIIDDRVKLVCPLCQSSQEAPKNIVKCAKFMKAIEKHQNDYISRQRKPGRISLPWEIRKM